ncbi:mucin-5AC-like [Pomacea canaliculata]|uniref:mucin-5AC-like n=1 Tax=Pomacea canaliculata TaxID=400727 RepID=UPI000D727A30|nr:mucin-5AC-like [Pomacea canaliculata]
MSIIILTFALAVAAGIAGLSAALSMATSSPSPWTSKSGSSQTKNALSTISAMTEVTTSPKLRDVTGNNIFYSTQTAPNTDSVIVRNILLGNTLSKSFVSSGPLMSHSTSSRKVSSSATVFPPATGTVSVYSKSTTPTTQIVSDVFRGPLLRILMSISGPGTSTESDTTPTPTSTPTHGSSTSSSSASLPTTSDSSTLSGITYGSVTAPSGVMSDSPVTTVTNVMSESATTPAAVTSDCSTTPVGVTCPTTVMATTVVSASIMSGSPQTTPENIVNNNRTVPAVLVAGNITTRSASVMSDSPTTPVSVVSDSPTVGGSSVSGIFSGNTQVSETMVPSSSRFSSSSLPLSTLVPNTMTVSQHISSERTLPGVTGIPPSTMSASFSDSTAASGNILPGSSTNSGYIQSDSTIMFGSSTPVSGNTLSDSPTMSATSGSGTIPMSGSSPGVSTDSVTTLSANSLTTVATTDKLTTLTTPQTTKLTTSTTSTTTTTTTVDPVRCNGKLPPVSVDASLAVIAPQVIGYRCNDGFKETGRGSAIIECKKQQGWVDEAGKGNPAGLECERLRQEPEVPPWLYPALIALLAMLVLLVICFLVVYILRSRGVCARRKRSPEADPHLRRKPNPSSALSLPPGHTNTTMSGKKWSGNEKTRRSFWSSQIKSHDSRVYPAPIAGLRHGDGVPWVEA